MPQPKKTGSNSSARKTSARKPAARSAAASATSGSARKPAARKPAAKRTTARKPAAARATARKPAAARATAAAKPSAAAKKPAAARKPAAAKKPAARARPSVPTTPEELVANLSALRDRIASSVTLTTDRLQATVDDAVERGRITRKDAEELLSSLVTAGRQQTEAIMADLEQLLGRRSELRARAEESGDAVLRGVDRARRRVSTASFPILNYDNLSAPQITKRLRELTPAQLRKVRDFERRHDARKTILNAIEKRLG